MAVMEPAPAPINYQACKNATRFDTGFNPHDVNSRMQLCFRTTEGRFAYVQITQVIDENNEPYTLGLKYIVWN
jgi:hypothetical protein